MINKFLIVFFISSNIFSQTQVVIVEEMLMDVPFAGEIKYTTTKYASDNLFKRDMEIEVGSFLARMAMGGNKKLGEFIDGTKKMRTVYDLNEEEYAQENFQTIIDNDGKPTLEIPFGGPMGGGGGGNSNNEENDQDEEARFQLMFAATLAGLAFNSAGVHIPHAMSYSVATLKHEYTAKGYEKLPPMAPHGIAVVLNAPAAFRFTGPTNPERHLEVAQAMGIDTRDAKLEDCLLYTSPSPRDLSTSRMPSSA